MEISEVDFSSLLKELTDIGVALSAEKDHSRLLEMILIKAMDVTNADGGSLYTHTDDKCLKFEIMLTRSLGVHKGGTSEEAIEFYPISLYSDEGIPNDKMVAAWAAISGETINIDDAYTSEQFDFSGTRNFDGKSGYRSKSFLTVPMTNHENELIGVLQLINAQHEESGEVVPFSNFDQQVVESLSSQAAVTITNRSLIDAQKQLFDALIQLIANAIDEKSPYTAGHCRRVPLLTTLLADAACDMTSGPLKDFQMTELEKYELEVAAWLHDCGKITTPEYVVDKGTKLETIFDRIHLVQARFEVLKRDAEIAALRRQINTSNSSEPNLDNDVIYQERVKWIENARAFIATCNIGGETIRQEDVIHIDEIASELWLSSGEEEPLLSDEETQNLKIGRGTLSVREREIINNHVSVTIKMLESLPYPKHLRRVPEYAGGHHEKIDGTGYPNRLKGEQMSVQARMVAIADVFEALTASDRPYKKAMPLSQSLMILGQMKVDGHIDPDLFDIFIGNKIYLKYAEENLSKTQIDDVDLAKIPGYQSLA
ncbi:MAG: HD-GYP domain-containing protein (c-di-GMP phosphodiesterase class II) [Gammaproteobacteria bacterium]|jgi:HD-GYP domain-containing protein (c-di-GMP phosphodiesterase class II)